MTMIHTTANYESRLLDNWNNQDFLQKLFENNPSVKASKQRRYQFESSDVEIDGFVYDTSGEKQVFCCHAETDAEDVQILCKNKDETIRVKSVAKEIQYNIAKEKIVAPLVETFILKRKSLVPGDFMVTPTLVHVLNVVDLA